MLETISVLMRFAKCAVFGHRSYVDRQDIGQNVWQCSCCGSLRKLTFDGLKVTETSVTK